jgi:hypothetical protein
MFLGASRAAMEQSRASRTKTTISKLHTLLMEQWNGYETKRVDLDRNITQPIDNLLKNNVIDQTTHTAMMHDLRLLALRETMKFEMPDRWSDVDLTLNPIGKSGTIRDTANVFVASVPTLARIYDRRRRAAQQAATDKGEPDIFIENQRAECLYMIVMYACGDGESRTMFSAQDIGDTDGDGAPEFLDGWGNPIEFLRWPAGFTFRPPLLDNLEYHKVAAVNLSPFMTGDTTTDHDPFDPFQRNSINALPLATQFPNPVNGGSISGFIQRLRGSDMPTRGQIGFRLVPLIYSGGPDGVPDIITAFEKIMSDQSSDGGALNPYFSNGPDDNYAMGAPHTEDGENLWIDNIHNHIQEAR